MRERQHQDLGLPASLLDIPGNVTIDPYIEGRNNAPWALLNHSRRMPNVVAKAVIHGSDTRMVLVTQFVVPPGFEYRWDYNRLQCRQLGQPLWLQES